MLEMQAAVTGSKQMHQPLITILSHLAELHCARCHSKSRNVSDFVCAALGVILVYT